MGGGSVKRHEQREFIGVHVLSGYAQADRVGCQPGSRLGAAECVICARGSGSPRCPGSDGLESGALAEVRSSVGDKAWVIGAPVLRQLAARPREVDVWSFVRQSMGASWTAMCEPVVALTAALADPVEAVRLNVAGLVMKLWLEDESKNRTSDAKFGDLGGAEARLARRRRSPRPS